MSRVRTEYGVVEGAESAGLHVFRNLPYAAPPFGPLRFRPPQPPATWSGVRDATQPGPAAPQPVDINPLPALYLAPVTGEDCLTLEIWTPDPGAAGLPVLVHIHGGGYVFGAGSVPGYSGRTFARDGIVHVGINYRLGIEGFLYLGDGTDNLGLRDQTAALEWVRRNIAAFGGDPDRVTIFGQSGGAVSVFNQLAMPASRGLFARAIAQSGCPAPSVGPAEALRMTRRIARGLGVEPTADALAAVPVERTVAATDSAIKRFARGLLLRDRRSLLLSPFRTVHDTETVPMSALDGLMAGVPQSGIPLLTGTTRNELVDLMTAIEHVAFGGPVVRRGIRHALRLDRAMRDGYRNGPRHITSNTALVEAAWTDWGFRIPTIRFVQARSAPSWLYEFRWQATARPPLLGAMHGIDLPFVRDDLDLVTQAGPAGHDMLGTNPPHKLAAAMHEAWIRFAATGDPGWPRYEQADRATMVFDTPCEVVNDAAGPERELWEGRVLRTE